MDASSPPHDRQASEGMVLEAAVDHSVEPRAAAIWALRELAVRAGLPPLEVTTIPGDGRAREDRLPDIGYGRRGGAATIPHDPASWREQRWDAPPDARRDPLAAAFWWLARVEELRAPDAAFDRHGRFRYAASHAARIGAPLATPVDDLALQLFGDLAARGGESPRAGSTDVPWRLVATHDVDLPWRWTRSGVRRCVRGIRDDLRSRRIAAALAGAAALAAAPGWRLAGSDPWCNAVRIRRLERRLDARSTSYLHVGGPDPHDGDPAATARGVGRFARHLAGEDPELVGLHGSYGSSDTPGLLAGELERLEQLGVPCDAGTIDHRFHYLRHRPVDAWPILDALGMRSDSSLGWAERPGFRAGTAHPFQAWDHGAGRPLALVIIPLALMDASLDARHLGLGAGPAGRGLLDEVLDAVAAVGGCASVLWHNDRLGRWEARRWRALYRRALERAPGGAITAGDAAREHLRRIGGRTAVTAGDGGS